MPGLTTDRCDSQFLRVSSDMEQAGKRRRWRPSLLVQVVNSPLPAECGAVPGTAQSIWADTRKRTLPEAIGMLITWAVSQLSESRVA
jgi:hypothetical protein